MGAKTENKKNKQQSTAPDTKQGEKKDKQKWQNTSNDHPDIVIFHQIPHA